MYAYHTHTYTYIYLITNVSGHVRLEYVLSKIIYESKRIRKNTFIKRDIINFFILQFHQYFRTVVKWLARDKYLEKEKLNFEKFLDKFDF